MSAPAGTPRVVKLGTTDFITSDLHIGGAPFPYSMWGYKTAVHWASKVAEVWDYQAGAQSTIVVVGDALDGTDGPGSTWLKSWYAERPGRKLLVPGNHDSVHPYWKQERDHLESQGWFDVFEVIEPNSAVLELPGGRQVAVCHFAHGAPMWTEWHHTNRALPLVHGHNHSRQKVTLPTRGAQRRQAAMELPAWSLTQIHIGWAAWRQLAPVPAVEQLVNEEAPVKPAWR